MEDVKMLYWSDGEFRCVYVGRTENDKKFVFERRQKDALGGDKWTEIAIIRPNNIQLIMVMLLFFSIGINMSDELEEFKNSNPYKQCFETKNWNDYFNDMISNEKFDKKNNK
jgi:hypothetical protein